MTILIAGDSYSTDQDFRPQPKSLEYYSWVTELKKIYPCQIKAKAGASNWDIIRQLNCEYSYAIVNLTAFNRVSYTRMHLTESWNQESEMIQKIKKAGKQHALKILSHSRCYFWSPFPIYETWPKVDYIELRRWDELWDDKIIPYATGNHLTREGNDWMINHMSKIIEEIK